MEKIVNDNCIEMKEETELFPKARKKKSEEKVEQLQGFMTEFEELRKKSNSSLSKINASLNAAKKQENNSIDDNPKFHDVCEEAYENTLREMECLQNFLNVIYQKRAEKTAKTFSKMEGRRPLGKDQLLKAVEQAALSLPLWINREDREPPPLCGAVPAPQTYIAKVGEFVAALVKVADDEVWILSEVVNYDADANEYTVEDIDEEQKQYIVRKEKVIPLPQMRANPEDSNDRAVVIFPENAIVLARFPQTTCFYRAVVYRTPKTFKDPYIVLFEDNTHPSGYSTQLKVHQRYVLNCAEFTS